MLQRLFTKTHSRTEALTRNSVSEVREVLPIYAAKLEEVDQGSRNAPLYLSRKWIAQQVVAPSRQGGTV